MLFSIPKDKVSKAAMITAPQVRNSYRLLVLVGSAFCIQLFTPMLLAQDQGRRIEDSLLREVMPVAQSFSEKQGTPPVIEAYTGQIENRELVGYVLTTPDYPPEETGYSGTIDLLVGLDLMGNITGVKALDYQESHRLVRGDFINESGFLQQFVGRNLGDELLPGQDIDGMSRATITSWAVARGLRNSARRFAVAYLPDSAVAIDVQEQTDALQSFQEMSWSELVQSGYVKEMEVPLDSTGTETAGLTLSIAYMGHYRLGELLIGAADYSNADRTASGMVADGHMMLLGLRGRTSQLQQLRLGAMQDDVLYPNTEDRVVFAGTGNDGKIKDQAQLAVALFLDPAIDIARSFSLLYDTSSRAGDFENYVGVEYHVPDEIINLVLGRPSIVAAVTDTDDSNWWGIGAILLILAALALGLRLAQVVSRRPQQAND